MKNRLPKDFCNLKFKTAVKNWDEALPLGNGFLGCLVWGDSDELRMSLDRGDLWDKTPCPVVLREDFTYQTLVDMAKRGDADAYREMFNAPYDYPTPTKLPAGKLIFKFKEAGKVSSELDLATAEAGVTIAAPSGDISLKSYLHAEEQIGFIRIDVPRSAFHVSIRNPKFGEKSDAEVSPEAAMQVNCGSLERLHYPAPEYGKEGSLEWFVQPIDDNMAYGIVFAQEEENGKTYLAYTVACSLDGDNWLENAKKQVYQAVFAYEERFRSHAAWWEEYWSHSCVRLPDPLFEKNWYLSNYLFGSCSRNGFPPSGCRGW